MISSLQAQEQAELPFPVYHFQLRNGLQVILSEDNSLPIVSVVIAYNVGSIHEQQGKTGLAYLMENLMFQGSSNVSRMQHILYINRIGGTLNAATTEEKTIFFQTVPSNQLALVLWLESDRMKFLEIKDSNVERVKDSLVEEIQHRKTADPYLESSFIFDKLFYPSFAHNHPVIGTREDLRGITIEDIKSFYSTFYVPNNAVLCVVGNVKRRRAEELIRKYFESIPKGKDIPSPPPVESDQKKRGSYTHEDSIAPLPGFFLGYRFAPRHPGDFFSLSILNYILLRGKSSRLHKRLYKRERIVFDFNGGIEKRKDFAAFKLFVLCNNEIMVERSLRAILSEINRLKTAHVSDRELTKSKNMFKMDYVSQYATFLERALFLTDIYLTQGTLERLPAELNRYLGVSAIDIIGVINRYFISDNRIVLNIKIK
ncbi:MAG: peptidase M16 [Candidatus Aminicenantes bacterium]|nr:peptidase M16 [Candidatus Aminicenantes bacterium]